MSKPIEILMDEHRLIEQVLGSMGAFMSALPPADEQARKTVGEYARFFRLFADQCHHGKEEDLLFEALKRQGMPAEAGPLAVMMHEHESGRALVRELAAISEGEGGLTEDEQQRARTAAAQFIALLSAHIQKEDNVLFPAADRMLSSDTVAELKGQFDAFERRQMDEGLHESMRRLAESLVGSYPA
jgi:hemerythrin-like domain-containing protein